MTKKETIVAFDFDGTITTKDTLLEFIRHSKGKWCFYGGFLLFSPLLIGMKLNLLPNWKVKQLLFSFFYKKTSVKKFDQWAVTFIPVIEKIVRPDALTRLTEHKNNADKIVIISASIENWIKPWAYKTGIDTIIATKIKVTANGLITGRFLTNNCYGQEKVNRLLQLYPNKNTYILVAYGDSPGDKELLQIADKAFYKEFE